MTRGPDDSLRAVLDVLEEFATWLDELSQRVAALETATERMEAREQLRSDAEALSLGWEIHHADLGCPPA
jgi:uncharacterized small protein (DUF1192 family)